MSKRAAGANFGTGEERYGGEAAITMDNEKPLQATAAQMARRKIAQARKPGANRARSGSPAVGLSNGGNMQAGTFGNSNQAPPQGQNPFQSTNFNFTFGAPQQQQQEGSASPAPFQFGSSAPPPSTNGGSNMFGGNTTPSFGTSFNAGSAQPQQNGFGAASSNFNQPSQSTNTTTSFSFGASQQPQANGTPATSTGSVFGSFGKPQENAQTNAPSFGFGAAQQDKDKATTPFSGFGATQQEKEKSNTTFGGFGAIQQEKEKEGTPFSGFGALQQDRERSNTPFSGFGAAQSGQESSKASNPFAGFGQNKQDSSSKAGSLFAGTVPKASENGEKQTTPFSGFGQKQAENVTAQSNSSFTGFGQQKPLFQHLNGEKAKSPEKEALSNPFAGFGQPQTNGAKTSESTPKANPFSLGQSSTIEPPSTNASNIFGGLSQASQPNGEKTGLFGAKLIPETTASSADSIFSNLPKKDLSNGGKPLFDSSDPSQIYREEDDNDNNDEADLVNSNIFGRSVQKSSQSAENPFKSISGLTQPASSSLFPKPSIGGADLSMTTPGSTPQKSLFSKSTQSQTPAATNTSATPAPSRSLFDRTDRDDLTKKIGHPIETPKAVLFGTDPAQPATVKSSFLAPASTNSAASLFKPSQPSQLAHSETPAAAPSRSLFDRVESAALQSSGPFTPAPPVVPTPAFNAPATAPAARTTAAPSHSIASNTLAQSSGIVGTVHLTDLQKARIKDLNDSLLTALQSESLDKDWTAIFDFYAKNAAAIRGLPAPTPQAPSADAIAASQSGASTQPSTSANLFSKTGASMSDSNPAASSNIFSQSARAHDSSTTAGSAATNSLFSKPPGTAPQAAKKRAFQDDDNDQASSVDKRSKPNEPISYPKLPETASSTAKLFESAMNSTKAPMPSAPGSSNKLLFSTSASQNVSSAPPPSGGFTPTFSGTSGGGGFLSAFGNKAKQQQEKDRKRRKDEDYDSEEETEEQWEKRDREEQEAKRKKLEDAAKSAKGFTLSGTSTPTGESVPKTPFQFDAPVNGAASTTPAVPPPQFNNLFGITKSATAEPGKLAPPTGFSFGPKPTSTDASRATTPGVTTDGEASTAAEGDEGEPSDEPRGAEPGNDDHTALQPAEREENDVLLELQNTISKLYRKSDDADKPAWTGVGSGRLYVLKEKSSGKTRVLNRVGVGRTALNFHPVKGIKATLHPKKAAIVVAPFMDHIHSKPAKIERFYITTESPEDAKELQRLLNEGAV